MCNSFFESDVVCSKRRTEMLYIFCDFLVLASIFDPHGRNQEKLKTLQIVLEILTSQIFDLQGLATTKVRMKDKGEIILASPIQDLGLIILIMTWKFVLMQLLTMRTLLTLTGLDFTSMLPLGTIHKLRKHLYGTKLKI